MNKFHNFPEYAAPGMITRNFYPYEENGGTIIAIAGDGFVIVGADSRLSSGYAILGRSHNRIFNATDKIIFASGGCFCDSEEINKQLTDHQKKYEKVHGQEMSTKAMAQLLSIKMYSKRFFPFYVSNVIAGLDENGQGCVYSYDPVGHCELSKYRAVGEAGTLLQPLLDSQIGLKNRNEDNEEEKLTFDDAKKILIDAFVSATEREIHTGDKIFIVSIKAGDLKISEEEIVMLKKD